MQVKQDGLCRGDGKIFIRYVVSGIAPGAHITLTNETRAGNALPCKLYDSNATNMLEGGDNGTSASPDTVKRAAAESNTAERAATEPDTAKRAAAAPDTAERNTTVPDTAERTTTMPDTVERVVVVVLPNIPTTQCITFFDGADKVQKRVNFEVAKWNSRINYHFNKDIPRMLRNYDESALFSQIQIEFDELVPADNIAKVHGTLLMPVASTPVASTSSAVSNATAVSAESASVLGSPVPSALTPSTLTPSASTPVASTSFVRHKNIALKVSTVDGKWTSDNVVWLGEKEFYAATRSTPAIREISFSIDVPARSQYLIFEAFDRDHPDYRGFGVLEKTMFKYLRTCWIADHLEAITGTSYEDWFERHRAKAPEIILQSSFKLDVEPTFSIIVPLYKTPIKLFEEMLDSVERQSYGRWELMLVNASPDDEVLARAVASAVAADSRVKVVTLEDNLGISGNTWLGIEQATGDFICFFDHDDTLEPNALFEYARAIEAAPETGLLYCDEDKLYEDGSYGGPFFKPDFSIDLLRNNNYVCHFLCVRRSLLDQVEPSTREVDGAQDHDLTLKIAELTDEIVHVPEILYHWRVIRGSTAADPGAKDYANAAGQYAIEHHLARVGLDAEVRESGLPFSHHVIYKVKGEPLVSIVIADKGDSEALEACLASVREKTSYANYEIIVVDEASATSVDDAGVGAAAGIGMGAASNAGTGMAAAAGATVESPADAVHPNFSRLINSGVAKSRGEYIVLLESDTEVITPDWIEIMLGYCQRADIGVVGAKLWYPDDTIQHAGVAITRHEVLDVYNGFPRGDSGYYSMIDYQQNKSAVRASCMMVSREMFDAVGGFDEQFAAEFNDVDFCLKVRECDKMIAYLPFVELYHYVPLARAGHGPHATLSTGAGHGKAPDAEAMLRRDQELHMLKLRWAKYFIYGDPYYNKNFNERYNNR